jgi:hypothetical protein
MTEFLSQHHDAMIRAPKAKDYISKHIMPALMEVGVYEYNVVTKKFRLFEYREAEMKILQKVRDRKKYLRDSGQLLVPLEGAETSLPPLVRTRSRRKSQSTPPKEE